MKEDFLDLLADQTEAMGPDSLPELEQGELRPIVGNAITDLAAGGIRMSPNLRTPSFGDQNAEQFALDVRSLLLYAHTVVVPNPFAAPLDAGGRHALSGSVAPQGEPR